MGCLSISTSSTSQKHSIIQLSKYPSLIGINYHDVLTYFHTLLGFRNFFFQFTIYVLCFLLSCFMFFFTYIAFCVPHMGQFQCHYLSEIIPHYLDLKSPSFVCLWHCTYTHVTCIIYTVIMHFLSLSLLLENDT